jgi:hypothetical protein
MSKFSDFLGAMLRVRPALVDAPMIRRAAQYARRHGVPVVINYDDDAVSDDGEWVTSVRRLLVHGDEVASWERYSYGGYGLPGSRPDVWSSVEDHTSGTPYQVRVFLEAVGLEEDPPPVVEEPPAPSTVYSPSPDGEYVVVWQSAGNDDVVIARYDTLEAADAVAAEYSRSLAGWTGGGPLLCGYVVRAAAAAAARR